MLQLYMQNEYEGTVILQGNCVYLNKTYCNLHNNVVVASNKETVIVSVIVDSFRVC